MQSLRNLSEGMLAFFEAKDRAREETLRLSREIVRDCSVATRYVHKRDFDEAKRLLNRSQSLLKTIRDILKEHQDVRYAGFLDNAEQEFAEAKFVYHLISGDGIPTHNEIDVDMINYLSGLGDATGELRRHILNIIRSGKPEEGEYFLEVMEEIYYMLMLFDYPEAITRGLRRKSDLARSMLEKTRGDLTNAIAMAKLTESIRLSKRPP
ncbi:MAG: translin family protein [Methanotrichaceae archaeon]|nr:translin family protein [Methanotrichaceae archaeon]